VPPLNPRLYAALNRSVTGGVKRISNQGQPMAAVYLPDLNGRPRLTPSSKGEYYVLACPFCHDTSGHLYVNHRWGVRDPVNGTRNLWLATCFLSDCLRSWENRKRLLAAVEDYAVAVAAGAVRAPEMVEAAAGLARCDLPDDFRLLTDLPRGHPARSYVRRRGFGPMELAREWGVGFSAAEYREVPGRLVIPLRACLGENAPAALGAPDAWTVVGYQGRLLGDAGRTKAKYLTTAGTAKSRLLYGLDRVPPGAGPVVVVEGPVDAWRAGPGAVAVLGKDISDEQCRLLRAVAPGRDVVVLFDPEAAAEARRAADKVRAVLARDLTGGTAPARVVVARLPDARDPGDCTAEEIAAAVRRALSRRRH
jgi:hypothetical protein